MPTRFVKTSGRAALVESLSSRAGVPGAAKIVLIRHGETSSNAERRLQVPETPLSRRGLAQAHRLGVRLAELGIERVLASDYSRAHMTAKCIEDATGAPIVLDAGLRERDFGDLRGRLYSELGRDPFGPDYVPPGGESWEALDRRVDAVWERITEAASVGGNTAVVTHGLVCHSLVSRHLALSEDMTWEGGFHNTSVTLVEPRPPWRVTLLNCTGHLDAATAHDTATRSGL